MKVGAALCAGSLLVFLAYGVSIDGWRRSQLTSLAAAIVVADGSEAEDAALRALLVWLQERDLPFAYSARNVRSGDEIDSGKPIGADPLYVTIVVFDDWESTDVVYMFSFIARDGKCVYRLREARVHDIKLPPHGDG